jgi:hypothetical protein
MLSWKLLSGSIDSNWREFIDRTNIDQVLADALLTNGATYVPR